MKDHASWKRPGTDQALHCAEGVYSNPIHPQLSMALEILQSARALGLNTLPQATLKRLAGLMNNLSPQHKLCVFQGLAHWFDRRPPWKS